MNQLPFMNRAIHGQGGPVHELERPVHEATGLVNIFIKAA
jgi:hypothetical protein